MSVGASAATRRLRIGVAGLGRAFTLMLPALRAHPRIQLVAAADPRTEARASFERDFDAPAHDSLGNLLADRSVEAVYVATPHEHHAEHAIAAAQAGKHVLVEKPMALTLDDAAAMGAAARAHGVHLLVGHSHSFDAPIARARSIVASGELGRVGMITAINFTDFLYRPRRPEELDTARGGGVLFSQAAHQVDIVRLLGGGLAKSVRAQAGRWDQARPTEGAYASLVTFEGGAFACLAYNGYGHFDSDELCGWVSELGREKDSSLYGAARRSLAATDGGAEAAAKHARNYGGCAYRDATRDAPWHEHFGMIVVSCEKGDIRPLPRGVWIHGDSAQRFEALGKPAVPRAEVLDELCDATLLGRRPLHDAAWGTATLEVCIAMLQSARDGCEVALRHQVPAR